MQWREGPIGAAKGKQPDNEALCQPPPPARPPAECCTSPPLVIATPLSKLQRAYYKGGR